MYIDFAAHNTHWDAPGAFAEHDPHLRQLRRLPLAHRSSLVERLPVGVPGIYSLGGGRQIGKTTLVKQWMAHLLGQGVSPRCVTYLTGELIDDHHALVRLLGELTDAPDHCHHVIIDEVSYIRDWDKGIKFLADAGRLEQVALLLTGSDLAFLKEARMRFPGRRGKARIVDFHLYPLNFYEVLELKKVLPADLLQTLLAARPETTEELPDLTILYQELAAYLEHGGFLSAINDLAGNGRIQAATFATYSDWIRGDALKRGKQEHYLREILAAVIKHYGSQVSWNSLAGDISIDHPKTISDYAALLADMDALFIQPALLEDKLAAAPKKARKLMFTDPFIFHAVRFWLNPCREPYEEQVKTLAADPHWNGRLVEAATISQYRQYYPTYYIKAEGEVDLALVEGNGFIPLEIKWTEQLRPKDLKQIGKYRNGCILTKGRQFGRINAIPTEPLPLALLRLGSRPRPAW